MTDLVYDFISSGVDLLMTASVLSAIIVLVQTATVLTSVTAQQQANADMIDYYREFNHLDSKECSTVDIQSFILTNYKNIQAKIVFGKPSGDSLPNASFLLVDNGKITFHKWNGSGYTVHNIKYENLLNGKDYPIPWKNTDVWHCGLREDGEDLSKVWNGSYTKFKQNRYDGGTVTGIFAVLDACGG